MIISARLSTFFVKELIFRQAIISEATFFAKETPFIETSLDTHSARVAAMNEYQSSHIDAKDVIAFASLKMKEVYDIRY